MIKECSLTRLSATEAAALIRERKLGSEELVRALLSRIAATDDALHAWQFVDHDRAIAEARHLDSTPVRGPLHGVPFGIKDIIDTGQAPTGYGSPLYATHQPTTDAACVQLVRAAGGVPLGKTVTTEFALRTPSVTRNPHDHDRTPGGSSSGSAVAVAARTTPVALGTQTSGSIIRPAAFCGVYGYKPTFDSIPRSGIWILAPSFDTVGVFARNIADIGLLASVLSGRPSLREARRPDQPPRIAIWRTSLWDQVDQETVTLFRHIQEVLNPTGALVSVETGPPWLSELVADHELIMAFETAMFFERQFKHDRLHLSTTLRQFLDLGERATRASYRAASARADSARARIANSLSNLDAIITPSVTGFPPEDRTTTGDPLFARIWTLLHLPSLHIPIAFLDGAPPIGAQLVAAHRRDKTLIGTAHWLTELVGSEPKLAEQGSEGRRQR